MRLPNLFQCFSIFFLEEILPGKVNKLICTELQHFHLLAPYIPLKGNIWGNPDLKSICTRSCANRLSQPRGWLGLQICTGLGIPSMRNAPTIIGALVLQGFVGYFFMIILFPKFQRTSWPCHSGRLGDFWFQFHPSYKLNHLFFR